MTSEDLAAKLRYAPVGDPSGGGNAAVLITTDNGAHSGMYILEHGGLLIFRRQAAPHASGETWSLDPTNDNPVVSQG